MTLLRRLRRGWFVACSRLGYRRLLLIERPLDEPIGDVATDLTVTLGLLREQEISDYVALVPDSVPEEVRSRLAAGQRCFTVRVEGLLVCIRWAATGRMPLDYLGTSLDVADDEAYAYGLYADPAFRGHAISPVGSVAMLRHLRAAGVRRVVGTVLPENYASLRATEKSGYRVYGVVGRVKVGAWTRRFLRVWPTSFETSHRGHRDRTGASSNDGHVVPDKTGGAR